MSEVAQRDLQNLPRQDARLVWRDIQGLMHNPRPRNAAKLKGHAGTYRVRRGWYRALYTIDDRARVVRVFRVDHRKDVYR